MTIVHMLKAGDGIVCMNDVYGGEPCVNIILFTLAQSNAAASGWRKKLRTQNEIITMLPYLSGTNRYFKRIAAEISYDVSFSDFTKLDVLKAALKPNTKV